MKAAHINAFLVPAAQVIRKMARTDLKLGKIEVFDDREYSSREHRMCIIIGVKGDLSGSVILSSSNQVAAALSALIVKEEPQNISESDLRDILSEVANTIVGNATGELYNLGIKAGITPPTVILGSGVIFRFDSGMDTVKIQLLMDIGEMSMVVSLTRQNPV